jgi:hypothetical protein
MNFMSYNEYTRCVILSYKESDKIVVIIGIKKQYVE